MDRAGANHSMMSTVPLIRSNPSQPLSRHVVILPGAGMRFTAVVAPPLAG
jgi:hypothetical protein